MSSNTTNTTKKWLKFFSDGGLPIGVATNYAMIFTEHRIQNDMLSDLTKEILYDMGIKTMGDVIAILRHAKSVDHNKTRDQLLGSALESAANEESAAKSTAKSQPQRPLTHRFKTMSTPDSTQNSNPKIVGLKRTAETSGLIQTNPKMRRIIMNNEEEVNEDFEDDMQSLIAKSSVFSRLGADKPSESPKISSIFDRLGGIVSTDPTPIRRRVTIGGNSIDTNVQNRNLNTFDTNKRLLVSKTISKKPILPPTPGMRGSGQSGMVSNKLLSDRINSRQHITDTISVKDRIGVVRTSRTIPTTNRMVVNRSTNGSNLAMNRINSSGPSAAVAKAKRIAMVREVKAVNSKKKTTISLRKNIFDRLGPISL